MKEVILDFINLMEEISAYYFKFLSKTLLSDEDIVSMTRFKNAVISVENETESLSYFGELFNDIYNKRTKYAFFYNHEKVRSFIIKESIVLYIGSNIDDKGVKKELINTWLPVYKVMAMAVHLNQRHQVKIQNKPDIYTNFDDDYVFYIKLIQSFYKIFYELENKTNKKSDLRNIVNWCETKIDPTKAEENEEINMKSVMKDSMEMVKGMDLRALVGSIGLQIPEEVNLNEMLEEAMEGEQGEDMIDKLMSNVGGFSPGENMAGGISNLNEEMSEMFKEGEEDIEEIEKEIFEEFPEDKTDKTDEID